MELMSFYIDLNSEALEQQMLLTALTSNRGYDIVNRFKLILPNASTLTFRVVLWNPSVFVTGENIFVKLFFTFFPANALTESVLFIRAFFKQTKTTVYISLSLDPSFETELRMEVAWLDMTMSLCIKRRLGKN